MKINWFDEVKTMYEAVVWEDDNNLLLDEDYTTKTEAFKAVKKFKKSYKGKGKLECYVRFLILKMTGYKITIYKELRK